MQRHPCCSVGTWQSLAAASYTLAWFAAEQVHPRQEWTVRSLVRLRRAASVKRRVSSAIATVGATDQRTRCLATVSSAQARQQSVSHQQQHDRSEVDDSRQSVSALSSSSLSRPSSLPVAPWHLTPRPVSVSALGVSRAAFDCRNIAIIGAPGSGQGADDNIARTQPIPAQPSFAYSLSFSSHAFHPVLVRCVFVQARVLLRASCLLSCVCRVWTWTTTCWR